MLWSFSISGVHLNFEGNSIYIAYVFYVPLQILQLWMCYHFMSHYKNWKIEGILRTYKSNLLSLILDRKNADMP